MERADSQSSLIKRTGVLWLVSSVAGIVVTMRVADHPIVRALERSYRHSATWASIERFFQPDPILLLLVVVAAWAIWRRHARRPLPRAIDDLGTAGIAAAVAGVVVVALKVFFGRSWPDPTFASSGVDEFRWFTGEWSPHHGAFPSATACISTAIAVALWRRGSPARWVALVLAAACSVIVVVQEYHWLSDALAGVLLGTRIWSRPVAKALDFQHGKSVP